MTAIKEYPFDLSDILDHPETESRPVNTSEEAKDSAVVTQPSAAQGAQSPLTPITRKISTKTKESNKNRENQPRDRRISAHAEGPSQRKSILHNSSAADLEHSFDKPIHIEGRFKKFSTTSFKKTLPPESQQDNRSWWYAFCAKCHQEESDARSWEPPFWQSICPYPLCPTYRLFAQTLSLFIIGILMWMVVWVSLGDTAAPGGQLFMLIALTVSSYFGGWLILKITTLPALIGMLFVGIILRNVGFVQFDELFQNIGSFIRKVALTILLARAGLDLDPIAMKKYFLTMIKLSILPWTFECILCAIMSRYLLNLPWDWAFLLSSIMAAVSPAVIVPCLFRLRNMGYGVAKGIPTLVLAVSGVDDAASVAIFGVVSSFMFTSSSLTINIIQGPVSIFGGIAFGVFCGYVVKYVPVKTDNFAVPLRVLMLLTGGLIMVLGSERVGWGGAGPLAVIAFAFMSSKNWSEQGWQVDDNPVATAFEIFWMIFEPLLFSLTGAQVVIANLEAQLVLVSVAIISTCLVTRMLLTSALAVRSNLNTKEKFFVGLSWMAKATVQAALAPVALDEVRRLAGHGEPSHVLLGYADTVLTVCIISIVVTAPLGAIVITIAGPRLLTKTTKPPILEGWRRSNRPSIRDISINEEDEIKEEDATAENIP